MISQNINIDDESAMRVPSGNYRTNYFRMKRMICKVVAGAMLTLMTTFTLGLADGVDEYLLKAIFFERFTRFVDYGPLNPDPDSSFVITIYGDNPFGNRLEKVYLHQNILNKKVKVMYADQLDQIGDPDILYIGKDKKQDLEKLLLRIRNTRTITIADSAVFSGSGVMINLLIVDNKIRFEIDLDSASRQHIKFDRVLLVNAIIVKHEGTK